MSKEVERIKEKLDIVDFISSYLPLQKAGKNFKALCPFHQEKTPSFVVSPERQMWYCFGACGEGGDIIKFLMKYENLEFYEALKFLAERAGIELAALNPAAQREIGGLYDIHEKAKEFFRKELFQNPAALEYLKNRGLGEQTIEEFELGFSPGGETLTLHLLNMGYDIDDLVKSGLVFKSQKGMHRDKFEKRIIFPIYNHLGKVVAFTGRLFLDESNVLDLPKYLNSPETPIFNKSKILYGFHKSKNSIAQSKSVLLVEGQMDFLMGWQAGIKNIAAVSGTALSQAHLETLRRLADTVIISFDNDEAGLKALERSLDVFGNFDFFLKALNLSGFKDPAEAILKNQEYFLEAVNNAQPVFSYLFKHYLPTLGGLDNISKKRALRHLLSKIKKIPSAVERDSWIKELVGYSGVSEVSLNLEMAALESLPKKENQTVTDDFIKASRLDLISQRLITLIFAREDLLPHLHQYRQYLPLTFQEILDNLNSEKAAFFKMRASYEFDDLKAEVLEKEFQDLIKNLQIEFLKQEGLRLKKEIKEAEKRNDNEELDEKSSTFSRLSQELHRILKI